MDTNRARILLRQELVAHAAALWEGAEFIPTENEYLRGQIELIRDATYEPDEDGDVQRDDVEQAIRVHAAEHGTPSEPNLTPGQQALLRMAGWTIIPPSKRPSDGRVVPISEADWKRQHRNTESTEHYDPPRPVIVPWHDPTETPTECIVRLSGEVADLAARLRGEVPK